jgi:hypothetical protein
MFENGFLFVDFGIEKDSLNWTLLNKIVENWNKFILSRGYPFPLIQGGLDAGIVKIKIFI